MTDVDKKQAWLAFAHKLFKLGKKIYLEADMTKTELGTADLKVIALTLLCRTMSNFQGAIAMIDQGLIVEARTLTRCCYENLIWIEGLAAKGSDFVREIGVDEYARKQSRGKVILDWAAKQNKKPQFEQKLQAYLEKVKEKHQKLKPINLKTTAASGVLPDTYVIYGQLSSDAAHPSAESLSRHVRRTKVSDDHTVLNIEALPQTKENEVDQTLEFACGALIGICVGTNQILGSVPSGKELAPLIDEFVAIRKTSEP